jgi:asparagine synthase (glutamine-hydrolysing)
MCGIVFILSHKRIEENLLATIRDKLIHRGPDGFGQFIEQTKGGYWVGLAHRRLSIVDLSENGKQPMENDDGTLIITFNGEIYNYKDIKQELLALGCHFKTQTDTEVLLKAYEEWGTEVVHKLNGMFAFIIWDKRKQIAFIVRDRFGEKPLYYAYIPSGGVIFASEIKAILAHPEIKKEINQDKSLSFVQGILDIEAETFFKKIHVFPKANWSNLSAERQSLEYHCYWKYDYEAYHEYQFIQDRDYEEFGDLLSQSLVKRLDCDVPCAFYLSGGLDSSSLCSIAAKRSGYNFNTFSIRFDNDPSISEGDYIDIISGDIKIPNFSYTPSAEDLLYNIQKIHFHHEQPLLSSSYFLESYLLSKVKEKKYKVIIDGQGSDEVLGGYHFFIQSLQKHFIDHFSFFELIKNSYNYNLNLSKESKVFDQPERRIVNGSIGIKDCLKILAKRIIRGSSVENDFKYAFSLALNNMLPKQLHSADRNSMAFGIEVRLPFLDYKLVDFLMKKPLLFFVKNGYLKFPLRRALKNTLHDSVRLRVNKLGFAGPEDIWINGPLYEWVCENIKDLGQDNLKSPDCANIINSINFKQKFRGDQLALAWRLASLSEFDKCEF